MYEFPWTIEKKKEKREHSRRTRNRRIGSIVKEDRIDDVDDTVVDKNVRTNDFRAHAARSRNKGSRRIGDEL